MFLILKCALLKKKETSMNGKTLKARLGFKAIVRDIQGGDGAYHRRESTAYYKAHFKGRKSDMDLADIFGI